MEKITPSHTGQTPPPPEILSRQQLDTILQNPDRTPESVLNFFDGKFQKELDADAGVHEGYTIREHTAMVMGQYYKYLRSELPDSVNPEVFEVILALHDIGKSQAIRNGDKTQQHQFTTPLLKETMTELGFDDEDIQFATALTDGDPIGAVLQTGDTSGNAHKITKMVAHSGLGIEDFWQALQVYYKADAGSYTRDAGGQPSLDFLFEFNPVGGKMSFSPDTQVVVKAIEHALPLDAAEPTAQP